MLNLCVTDMRSSGSLCRTARGGPFKSCSTIACVGRAPSPAWFPEEAVFVPAAVDVEAEPRGGVAAPVAFPRGGKEVADGIVDADVRRRRRGRRAPDRAL